MKMLLIVARMLMLVNTPVKNSYNAVFINVKETVMMGLVDLVKKHQNSKKLVTAAATN
jgi:hypothetical protein